MKIQIIKDGKIIYSQDREDDFVIVSKKMVEGANMSEGKFDELFYDKLKDSRTHREAFEKADEEHVSVFGHCRYSSFDSFRISMNNRLKK